MPLQRRLPKRGFTNIFKKAWIEVRLSTLEENFNSGDDVTPEVLHERGLIKKAKFLASLSRRAIRSTARCFLA